DTPFGSGAVLSAETMEFLRATDAETPDAITRALETPRESAPRVHGGSIRTAGRRSTRPSRSTPPEILRDKALSAGAVLHHKKMVKNINEIDDADLIIGADGVNSLVRRTFEREFGSSTELFENHFAWFGADRPFDRLTQTFKATPQG